MNSSKLVLAKKMTHCHKKVRYVLLFLIGIFFFACNYFELIPLMLTGF